MADAGIPPTAEPIRVLIADDHALFRRGLNMVLESEEGIEVVAEAEDGEDAVAKAEEFAPDVVLMDVRMPRLSGIEATRTIRDIIPTARILMLTVSDEEEDLYEAVKAGANGYLLKEISIEEVADAIRQVTTGQSLISPSMASKLLTEFNTLAKRAEEQFPPPRLTEGAAEHEPLDARGIVLVLAPHAPIPLFPRVGKLVDALPVVHMGNEVVARRHRGVARDQVDRMAFRRRACIGVQRP